MASPLTNFDAPSIDPKIVAVVLSLMAAAPLIGAQVYSFSERVYARIERGF